MGGDFKNDGRPDLIVSRFGGIILYRNNGDGGFTDVSKATGVDDPNNFFGLEAV